MGMAKKGETDDDLKDGEEEAEKERKADEAAKAAQKRREEFRKNWVPRTEHEKLKADLANVKHEKEIETDDHPTPDEDSAGGNRSGDETPRRRASDERPAEGEKKGAAPRKRGRIFPFPFEEDEA